MWKVGDVMLKRPALASVCFKTDQRQIMVMSAVKLAQYVDHIASQWTTAQGKHIESKCSQTLISNSANKTRWSCDWMQAINDAWVWADYYVIETIPLHSFLGS